jgi:hypothetical protein
LSLIIFSYWFVTKSLTVGKYWTLDSSKSFVSSLPTHFCVPIQAPNTSKFVSCFSSLPPPPPSLQIVPILCIKWYCKNSNQFIHDLTQAISRSFLLPTRLCNQPISPYLSDLTSSVLFCSFCTHPSPATQFLSVVLSSMWGTARFAGLSLSNRK